MFNGRRAPSLRSAPGADLMRLPVLPWVGCVSDSCLRSRYKRVFSVGTHGITTYNPTTLEVTNQVSICAACLTKESHVIVGGARPRCCYQRQAGRRRWDALLLDSHSTLGNPFRVNSSVAVFGPLTVHGPGTCPHPSLVAAHGSVKLQSIAI